MVDSRLFFLFEIFKVAAERMLFVSGVVSFSGDIEKHACGLQR